MSELDLDLTKPETIEKLKELDVTKKKVDTEAQKLEEAIKSVGKLQTFKIKLTAPQAAQIVRESSQLGVKPADYLQTLVEEKCLASRVGSPVISRVSHHTMNVTGPSSVSTVTRG